MSKNVAIILDELNSLGLDYEYDGTNLNTFMQWKNQGMSVKKGEKAFLTVPLWMPYKAKEKDEQGNEKTVTKFILKKSALFTEEQVQPIKAPKTKKVAKTEKVKKVTPKKVAPKKATEKVKEIVVAVTENLSNDAEQMSLF